LLRVPLLRRERLPAVDLRPAVVARLRVAPDLRLLLRAAAVLAADVRRPPGRLEEEAPTFLPCPRDDDDERVRVPDLIRFVAIVSLQSA
jgi:hypothetical protein